MNNLKLLSVAVLLVLAKSANAIEVEPNNDSSKANPLGKENVGKLNRASDVDFFSIDSCIKDNKKQCVKYTALDEKVDSSHKAGTDKRRAEVSMSFTCNNRSASTLTSGGIATSTGNGWFLGIHDSNGELQETYPIKPEDCIISDTTLGSFNFRFPSLDSQKYYVSVVSDCTAPIYNTVVDSKDSTKNIVNVNKFVTAALTKQADIEMAKAEAINAQVAIDETRNYLVLADEGKLLISESPDIYAPSSLHINSNANIQKLTDALALTNDITSIASTTLTPATNITAVISTAKAIEIAASTMRHTTFTFGQFLFAEAMAKDPSVQANIDAADILVTKTTEALKKAQEDKDADDKKVSDSKEASQTTYEKELAIYEKEVATNQADYEKELAAYEKEIVANQAAYDAAVTRATTAFDKANSDYVAALTLSTTNNSQETKDLVNITKGFRTEAEANLAKILNDGVAKVTTSKPTLKVATKPKKSTTDVLTPNADIAAALTVAIANKANAENAKKIAENTKTRLEKNLTDATAKYAEAKTKLEEALTALDNAVKFLNDTVKANLDAANAAENFVKRFDSDACKNYNTGIYTLKDNPDNEIKRLEDITSKAQKNLGLEQSGQISSLDDLDIYVVDSDGTTDVPLLFTCSAMAFRQTNNWKVSIFNDANGLVSATLINGSSCGSVFIGDKGGQSFKLPKGSQRYYLAVESACASSTKKDCAVDTSEYSILRDVDKVYSGKLTSKKIDAKSAELKLTNCGLNNNAVITIKAENVDLASTSKLAKLPINVQIGSTACRILTPELSAKDTIIGSVADASEIIDLSAKTKDSATVTLNECGSNAKSKVILTGSRLDFANLNPNNEKDSVIIPIKVNIGDFRCESKEVFNINDTNGEITYSNVIDDSVTPVTTADDTVTIINPITALATAKNISASQTNKLKSVTDVQAYYVDNSDLKTPVNFEFSCPDSVRFTNDWALSIYDKNKKLISSQLIDGSACGTGKAGDTGTFKFSSLKDSTRTYFVVKSACELGDSVCVVDSSQYQIKRIIPTVTTSTTSSATAPCFYSSCATSSNDTPIFGGN